jgi:hypothetical protein
MKSCSPIVQLSGHSSLFVFRFSSIDYIFAKIFPAIPSETIWLRLGGLDSAEPEASSRKSLQAGIEMFEVCC